MDFLDSFLTALPRLVRAFPLTLAMVGISSVLGILIGAGLAAAKVRGTPVLAPAAAVLVSFVRSNPATINLLLTFYGLPMLLAQFGVDINGAPRVVFAIAMLSLYHACFATEIFRAGYLSVDPEQKAAAASIGMTSLQIFRRVTLPQLLEVILPTYANAFIDLFGYTSVLFIIGLKDIMTLADITISNAYGANKVEVYLAVGLVYWVTVLVVARLFSMAEKRLHPQGGDVAHA